MDLLQQLLKRTENLKTKWDKLKKLELEQKQWMGSRYQRMSSDDSQA